MCSAEPQPSFHLEPSAWDASHVVMVTEGDRIDGTVTVLETWKGALKAGDMLIIPGLAQFKDKETRTIQNFWRKRTPEDQSPRIVTGNRMILFLEKKRRAEQLQGATDGIWQAASPVWGMKGSTVWIENGRTYAFIQLVNPGPSLLVDLRMSEREMKSKVQQAARTQEALRNIGKVADNAERARQVRRFAESAPFYGQGEAFAILGSCKEAGIPVLEEILNDHRMPSKCYAEITQALVSAAGTQAEAVLIRIVQEETQFLKLRTSTLPVNWWTVDGLNLAEATEFRNHYHKLDYVVYKLQEVGSEKSKRAVEELKEYVESLPKPENPSWLTHLSQTCDSVLQKLQENQR